MHKITVHAFTRSFASLSKTLKLKVSFKNFLFVSEVQWSGV